MKAPIRFLLAAVSIAFGFAGQTVAAPGDVDSIDLNILGSWVTATAVQPDGKVIIAGLFSSVLGVPRNNIARLNADGTLDMGFDPNTNGRIDTVVVQPDGKVLLGGGFAGGFTTLQPNGASSPTPRNHIARVNADGTLDTGFDPNANEGVYAMALQADGKVLLGGGFTTLQPNGAFSPVPRFGVARVNGDGTLDAGFNLGSNGNCFSFAIQDDGKVVIAGNFGALQPTGALSPTTRNFIARVNGNGTLDEGFNPNANNIPFCLLIQSDGKILLGGSFTSLQPNGASSATARFRIARLNPDGTLDGAFDPTVGGGLLNSMALQADGKVLLGGIFNSLQPNGATSSTPRVNIARVNADGTLDAGFDLRPDSAVYSVAVLGSGKVLLGGGFSGFYPSSGQPTIRKAFARLNNDPAAEALSAPESSRVLWLRGGAAPEIIRVTFELSTNGGASWAPLGAGSRVGTTADWQLAGLSLPVSGSLRARGITVGGNRSGSSGIIETVAPFIVGSLDADRDGLLDSWELTYWPSILAHTASDDFDHDGLTELQELAFGLNPTLPDSALTPAPVAEGGYLTITLTKHPGAAYEVQSAGTLLSGDPASFSPATTTVLLDTATTLKVRDNVLLGTPPARFLRVKVMAAP